MAGDTELQVEAFSVQISGKSTGAMRPILRELMSPFESPFDILYGSTTAANYWWFAHVLWLKSAICGIFTFGTALLFDWQMFTHLLLTMSLALAVTTQPYISQNDRHAEAFVLLSLAMVSHVSSLIKSTEDSTLTLVYFALLVPTPEYNTATYLYFTVQKAPMHNVICSGAGGGFRTAAIHILRPQGCIRHAQPIQQNRRTIDSS
jgi:hypothetical protein